MFTACKWEQRKIFYVIISLRIITQRYRVSIIWSNQIKTKIYLILSGFGGYYLCFVLYRISYRVVYRHRQFVSSILHMIRL